MARSPVGPTATVTPLEQLEPLTKLSADVVGLTMGSGPTKTAEGPVWL